MDRGVVDRKGIVPTRCIAMVHRKVHRARDTRQARPRCTSVATPDRESPACDTCEKVRPPGFEPGTCGLREGS